MLALAKNLTSNVSWREKHVRRSISGKVLEEETPPATGSLECAPSGYAHYRRIICTSERIVQTGVVQARISILLDAQRFYSRHSFAEVLRGRIGEGDKWNIQIG